MNETKKAAYALHTMGVNITAIAGDGKAPRYQWKQDVDTRQDYDRLKQLPWGGYTAKDGTVVPAAGRVGILHSNAVGCWRCFDIDALKTPDGSKIPVDAAFAHRLLLAMGLPADYPWCMRSGSGAGWHVYIRCEDDLPAEGLAEKNGEKGVYTGIPHIPGDFEHVELRWHGVQSVPAFASVDDVPDEPPALVGGEQVIQAFAAVAQRTAPPVPQEKAPPARDDTVDQVKQRLDLVDVATKLYGEGKREGNEVRFPGNGGLLVNGEKQSWYCHQTEQGGDVLDLLCYHRYGSVLNGDKDRFKEVLKEAAGLAGVDMPAPAGPGQRQQPTRAHAPAQAGGDADAGGEEDTDRVTIDITNEDLAVFHNEVWGRVKESDIATKLYRYGNQVAFVDGRLLRILTTDLWGSIVSRKATFKKEQKKGKGTVLRDVIPSRRLFQDTLVDMFLPDWIPTLDYHTTTPQATPAGVQASGYKDGVLVTSEHTYQRMPVADALSLITDDLLGDFCFASDTDRANAIALLLLPFVRSQVECTPMHNIEAPTMGTGKGLLTKCLHYIWTGTAMHVTPISLDDTEQGKQIAAMLHNPTTAVVLDNVRALGGVNLEGVLTSDKYSPRKLGVNTVTLELPNKTVWIATGNNITLYGDMARRVVRIYLQPREEKPHLRTGFKHANLYQWVKDNRARLIDACLSLCEHGLAHGIQTGGAFGSFERYSDVLHTILAACDIPGFLGNLIDIAEENDTMQPWRSLVNAWYQAFTDTPVKPRQLVDLLSEHEDIAINLKGDTPRAQTIAFARQIKRHTNAIFSIDGEDVRIVAMKDRHTKTLVYRLEICGISAVSRDGDTAEIPQAEYPTTKGNNTTDEDDLRYLAVSPPIVENPRTRTHAHAHAHARGIQRCSQIPQDTASNGSRHNDTALESQKTLAVSRDGDTAEIPQATRQEAAAARYREEDYRLALLARLVTADTGREERTRLYAQETSELEALVYSALVGEGKGEEARKLADMSSEPTAMHAFVDALLETIETA